MNDNHKIINLIMKEMENQLGFVWERTWVS